MSNSLPEATRPLITSQEMFELFQEVLEKWAFLPSANIGPTAEGPATFPLERKVRFTGALKGTLVVRSIDRFGLYLWENVSGGAQASYAGAKEDAFTEFVNLLCGHLMSQVLKAVPGSFDPYLPEPSDPAGWPGAKPQVALALLVEDIPVELRVWFEGTQTSPTTTPRPL